MEKKKRERGGSERRKGSGNRTGDRHVVVGCEEGRLQLLDLSSSSVIADIAAHDEKKRVLALAALPDKTGFISGR